MQPIIDDIAVCLTNLEERLDSSYQLSSKLVDKYLEQINSFDRNKIGYNFVFMFASPSYLEIPCSNMENKRVYFPRLDCMEEYKRIKESVIRAKIEISVHKVHGTADNFHKCLDSERPGAIHFSGHGVTAENEKWKK
jgi:hypothetical protein